MRLHDEYPGDDAPIEIVAEWLNAKLAADFKARCDDLANNSDIRISWSDEPFFPAAMVEASAARVRAQYTDDEWNEMWRKGLELITAARNGDSAAAAEIISRAGPAGALLFCKPDDVPAVLDAAHGSWLRTETAAW